MNSLPPAIFINDWNGLNFLNSIATPSTTTIDWIGSGDGLLHWLAQARLAPPHTIETIRKTALPGELDNVAEQARNLREWFREIVRKHMGKPLAASVLNQLEPLNRLLERDEAYSRIVLDDEQDQHQLALKTMRRWRSPEALLIPIAEELARFICYEDFSCVKACQGPACTLIFADHTRGRARRWCSMSICGNRAKQSAHRKRSKEN